MTKRTGKIMACVPAYNEEKTIADVLVRVIPHVDELIVIDDGNRAGGQTKFTFFFRTRNLYYAFKYTVF